MISALIGAATTLGSLIYSGVKEKQANKRFNQSLSQSEQRARSQYQNDYYGNYLDRSDVHSILSTMRQQSADRNRATTHRAAVTGATPEAVLAQHKGEAYAYNSALSQIAGNATAVKEQAKSRYYDTLNSLDARRLGLQSTNLSQLSQAHYNSVLDTIQSAGNALNYYTKNR